VGRTLKDLSNDPTARGIFLKRLSRNGVAMPLLQETTIENGDIVTIVGSESHVKAVTDLVGYADRPRDITDMVFVARGIVVGALKIGLSSSLGGLLGGLVWGWLRSVHPTFGRIPAPTLWIFESLGLTGLVAVAGLAAGPDFVAAFSKAACAGAATATPALAAVQETARSPIPTLGYGISYAVGNVLLALWGSVLVALLK
jgi:putative transport protein